MHRVITAALLVAALSCLPAFAPAPPKPKARSLTAAFVVAPDSTVSATATVSMTGTFQPMDSIRYKFLKDGVVVLNKSAQATTYTATGLPAPAYGTTACYTVTAQVTRNGQNQANVVTSPTPWCYARPNPPPPPPPVVNGIELTPASATLPPGGTLQFTAKLL